MSNGHRAATAAPSKPPHTARVSSCRLQHLPPIATALGATAVLVVVILFSAVPALAAQTHPALGQFGGAGGPTFSGLGGLAVDQTSGDLYAYDSGAEAVFRFDSSGAPVDFNSTGTNEITGVGGSGGGENEIAIDSSSGETAGDVYVANNSSLLIYGPEGSPRGELTGEEPCGVAVDSAGDVYVGRYPETVDKYTPAPGEDAPTDADLSPVHLTAPIGLCNVGAQGDGSNVYTATYNGGLHKYPASQFGEPEAAGTELDPAANTLAVDPGSDHVFADEGAQVAEFDGSGEPVSTFGSGELSESSGVAVDSAGGDVYVADGETIRVFGPLATLPEATTGGASAIGPEGATLEGEVDPDGEPLTGCRFQFVPQSQFEAGGYTHVTPAQEAQCLPPFGSIPADEQEHPVSATLTALTPNTAYHFRLLAENAGGPAFGADHIFTSAGPPGVSETAVDTIGNTGARLVGFVDPNGQATTYRFEYISEVGWQEDGETYGPGTLTVPVPDAAVGSGSEALFVAQEVSGLSPATGYRFRLVATNDSSPASGTLGPDVTFTTRLQPLPADGRAYELVTPADKPGGQGVGTYSGGGDADNVPGLPSTNGERYLSTSAAGNLTPGAFLYNSDFALSERDGDAIGWASHSPFTHHEYNSGGGANTEPVPQSASSDLSVLGWGPGTKTNVFHLFPEMADWPRGTPKVNYASDWQGRWELITPTDPAIEDEGQEQFESADGSHLPFQTDSHGQLGPEDPSVDQVPGSMALYDDYVPGATPFLPSDQFTPNGVRSLVGVCTGDGAARTRIPAVNASGEEATEECPAAASARSAVLISSRGASIRLSPAPNQPLSTQNAISADGSRIFFMSPDPAVAPPACEGEGATTSCPAQLYIRQLDGAGQPTVRWISRSEVPGQEATLTGPALFEGASTTGSRVFFRTDSPLTADDPDGTGSAPVTAGAANPESWDLYEDEVPSNAEGKPDGEDPGNGHLTRISAGPTGTGDCNVSAPTDGGLSAGEAAGLRFASADGSRLYFVCAGVLPGVPTNGAPTDGTITTAGGTPATASTRNLYYYDADKPLAERWEFVARLPTGEGYAECATSAAEAGQPFGGFNHFGQQFSVSRTNCFKGSADGSFVTFMTPGRLVAGDPDSSSVDIYAFDAESDRLIRIDAPQGGPGGTYACGGDGAFVTAPTAQCFADDGYSRAINMPNTPLLGVATEPESPGEHVVFFESKSRLVAGDVNDQYDVYEWRDGRLSLVSTGTGDQGAYYVGNGASGRDVFIETTARLTWQDTDGVMDVYDARVGGGIPEPPPGTPCVALAGQCQPPPSSAPAASLAATNGFAGSPNQPTPKPKKNPRAKQGKKKHHKKHNHKKKHHKKGRRKHHMKHRKGRHTAKDGRADR
jgi:hypothetical protein